MSNQSDSRITGVYAGLLSLVEIGLGGFLHGMKIPFAGTFLSLNQGVFLTRVVKLNRTRHAARTLAFRVSNITALLKSLSPAGKKLLPMLAISMQGLLFSVGTVLLGTGLPGCLLGAILSSFWGVIQPLAVMGIIYGLSLGEQELQKMFAYFRPDSLVKVVIAFTALKASLAGALTGAAWKASFDEQDLLNQKLVKWGLKGLPSASSPSAPSHPALGALNDLKRPLFLIPFILTGIFFYFAEDSKAQFIWKSFRTVAAAYLFFLAIRLFPVDIWIKKRGLGGTALASALEFIEGKSKNNEASD